MHRPRLIAALAVALLSLIVLADAQPVDAQLRRPIETFSPDIALDDIAFVENAGQWDQEARFMARARGANVWFTDQRILFDAFQKDGGDEHIDGEGAAEPTVEGFVTALKFFGARGDAQLVADGEPLGVRYSWLRGEGEDTAIGARAFEQLVYKGLFDGVDVMVRPAKGRLGGLLKTTFIVHPGADPSQILYEYEGAESVRAIGRVTEGRDWKETVVVETEFGDFRETLPSIFQRDGATGRWVTVQGGYEVEDGLITIAVDDYDTSQPLYIDPVIAYSRPVGGGSADWVMQIREDATGLYAVGATESSDFPTTTGAYQSAFAGDSDGFAAKFDATTGDAQWITYVGGGDFERFTDFELDNGMVVVTGFADMDEPVLYPTTAGVYQPNPVKGNFHPVLTRLNANGDGLVYSTYLGADGALEDDDYGLGIALAADGSHYIVGTSESDDGFPTGTGLYDSDPDNSTSGGSNDNGFIMRVNADATALTDFSYIGGDNDDAAFDVELDSSGNPVVVNVTESTDFPVSAGAFQTTRDASQSSSRDDIGLIKFDPGLDSQIWGTYLGGNNDDQGTITVSYFPFADDRWVWHGLALDANDRPVVAGTTESTDFPTTGGAWQPGDVNGSTDDTFVAILSSDATALDAGTYLGAGAGLETFGSPVEIDEMGNVYVAGVTEDDQDFPIVAAVQPTYGGSSFGDGFATIFNPDLSGLVCSSYYGGSDSERILAIVAGPGPRDGRWGGYTNSPDFPTAAGATIGVPTGGFPDRNGFIAATNCSGSSLSLVEGTEAAETLPGRECFESGEFFDFVFSITNDSQTLQPNNPGPEAEATSTATSLLTSCTSSSGTCTVQDGRMTWNGEVPAGESVDFTVRARFLGGLKAGIETCLNVTLNFDAEAIGENSASTRFRVCTTTDCMPTVDPNRQLGGQVHLPILNFQGQDEVCETWIEVQNIGCEVSKAAMVTWGEPGFCPPQAAGPLKVECTGLMKPGSTWNLIGAQVPAGSKSGILFKFTARQLTELGLDLGFDDIVADFLCETLFFGVVGDADDYRRFKKAYNEGLEFAGVPLDAARGDGFLAADVHRTCPGDVTPASEVTSKYNGIAGTHLGTFDEVFGGFGYYVPLIYAGSADFDTVMYMQNGGLSCTSVEIWFKAKDDCIRNEICEILTLTPGETYQFDANDCVGPDFQGNAWLRSTQPLGVAVDIIGRDVMMTYVGEPAEINYTFDPNRSITQDGQQVAFGPLVYSEFQGWDTGIQVQNLSGTVAAKVKVYFLDRSGDIVTTLVDWVCPRGSQTLFLPVIAELPGNWVGSVRVESQEWTTPGNPLVRSPNVAAIAMLLKYVDAARTDTTEAIAYNLLPEHKIYDWQIGFSGGSLDTGIGLIAIPSLLRDLKNSGMTSEIAIANVVPKPGFTDLAIFLYDQNGLVDYVCQKLNEKQVEYIDLQTWGYLDEGFKGSAIISAFFWEHDVFDDSGFFLRNLVGLGAVAVERKGTALGEDVPGDESAGARGIPLRQQDIGDGPDLEFCFMGFAPLCPGFPDLRQDPFECPDELVLSCESCPLPITGNTTTTTAVNADILNQECEVVDVDLRLDITHTWYGDLFVDLSNEAVASSELFSDICGNFEDMLVTIDDDAVQPMGSVCASPLVGTFTTESGSGLDAFDGTKAGGRWRLDIFDDFPTDDGMLNDFEIILRTAE